MMLHTQDDVHVDVRVCAEKGLHPCKCVDGFATRKAELVGRAAWRKGGGGGAV